MYLGGAIVMSKYSRIYTYCFIMQVQKNHQGGMDTAQLAKKYFSQVSSPKFGLVGQPPFCS